MDTQEKIQFSEIISKSEFIILLWFFGSLFLGFVFVPAWIITLFLGLSVIPLLMPKILMNFFAFLSQVFNTNILGKIFAFLGLICLGILGLVLALMIFGGLTNPPLRY